jgi:glutamate/tyrosine decarboxylase-like PLP-dependent enzyme
MAQYIEDKLLKDHEWQIISPANMAIINFRYFDKHYNTDELDTINSEIAELAIKEGKIGVLSIKINDLKVLRICTIHPQAEIEQMDYLIDLLKKYARKIVKNIQKK